MWPFHGCDPEEFGYQRTSTVFYPNNCVEYLPPLCKYLPGEICNFENHSEGNFAATVPRSGFSSAFLEELPPDIDNSRLRLLP